MSDSESGTPDHRDSIVTGHTVAEAAAQIAPLLALDPADFDAYLIVVLPSRAVPGRRPGVLAATNLDPGQSARLAAEYVRALEEVQGDADPAGAEPQ